MGSVAHPFNLLKAHVHGLGLGFGHIRSVSLWALASVVVQVAQEYWWVYICGVHLHGPNTVL